MLIHGSRLTLDGGEGVLPVGNAGLSDDGQGPEENSRGKFDL